MSGLTDLQQLLATMTPVLSSEPYGIIALKAGETIPPGLSAFATIAEAEGLTLIAPSEALVAKGLEAGPPWARISLTVHSDLAAVGLTAAFATALGGEGISANVVAGYFHDHIFVQWTRRDDAVAALRALAGAAGA